MKRKLYSAALGICVISAPLWVGCGGDDGATEPETEAPAGISDSDAEVGAQMTELVSLMYQIGTLSKLYAQQAMVEANGGQGGLEGTCPAPRVNAVSAAELEMDLDYGSGCSADVGFEASGNLAVFLSSTAATDSVAVRFESFEIQGYSMGGSMEIVGSGADWEYHYAGIVGGLYTLELDYDVTIDVNGTPTDPTDDISETGGGGTVYFGPLEVGLDIEEDLQFDSSCTYPRRGAIAYTMATLGGVEETALDYDTGNCCTVAATVGTRTGVVELCSP